MNSCKRGYFHAKQSERSTNKHENVQAVISSKLCDCRPVERAANAKDMIFVSEL